MLVLLEPVVRGPGVELLSAHMELSAKCAVGDMQACRPQGACL